MAFDRLAMAQRLRELAARGVSIGTASWKYHGWFGRIEGNALNPIDAMVGPKA